MSGAARRRGVDIGDAVTAAARTGLEPAGQIVPNGPARESSPSVRLRPANAADCQRAWQWRNDPETRAASFESAEIPWDTHRRWFADTLLREDRRLFIVEVNGTPAGTTRLDIVGAEATVSIHLACEWRGRGVGTRAVTALADRAFGVLGVSRLLASVKPDNHASLAAFAHAGFTRVESGSVVVLERRRDA